MYECYGWRPADNDAIAAGGWTIDAQRAQCEAIGNVFTMGDGSKAPGCGGCWCCTRIIQGSGDIYSKVLISIKSEKEWKFWCDVDEEEDCGDVKEGRSFEACLSGS